MALRGQPLLSRMLITFSDIGPSSRGMIEYLEGSGKSLRKDVEAMGGQLVAEVRRNAEPDIRVCYFGGIHLDVLAQQADARRRLQSGAARWRGPRTTGRAHVRRARYLQKNDLGEPSHNPTRERLALARRIANVDTLAGQAANRAELEEFVAPDLSEGRYSIPLLLSTRGPLTHDPYAWPAWKLWGPSSKAVDVGNCSAERIAEHMWWLLRTTGRRSSKWGNNVERHTVSRPSVQGAWDPATAARLQHAQLTFSEVPATGS